jgi:hypothetical protein
MCAHGPLAQVATQHVEQPSPQRARPGPRTSYGRTAGRQRCHLGLSRSQRAYRSSEDISQMGTEDRLYVAGRSATVTVICSVLAPCCTVNWTRSPGLVPRSAAISSSASAVS